MLWVEKSHQRIAMVAGEVEGHVGTASIHFERESITTKIIDLPLAWHSPCTLVTRQMIAERGFMNI